MDFDFQPCWRPESRGELVVGGLLREKRSETWRPGSALRPAYISRRDILTGSRPRNLSNYCTSYRNRLRPLRVSLARTRIVNNF